MLSLPVRLMGPRIVGLMLAVGACQGQGDGGGAGGTDGMAAGAGAASGSVAGVSGRPNAGFGSGGAAAGAGVAAAGRPGGSAGAGGGAGAGGRDSGMSGGRDAGSGGRAEAGIGGGSAGGLGGAGMTGVAGLGSGGVPAAGGSAAGAGGSAGAPDDDRCSVAVYDEADPPEVLALSGNLGTHDPALIEAEGKYYLYATGDGLGAKTSADLVAWQGAPAVFGSNPAWIDDQVPDATNLWAPDISYFGGQYHLYYAASSFASNQSCIGHATRDSLASGSFTDHGSIFCSNVATSGDDFNAIDPNVIVDQAGTPWLSFGSFWSGIKLFRLKDDGTRADSTLLALADRPQNSGALEGPFIVRRCGYYYLFVSWGACCGDPWDYNMRVGRSTSVSGPYTDKSGKTMTSGGGTLLVQGNSTWTAPGHNAVIFTASGAYNVYHALDSSHQNPTLRVAELAWDADGWPISAGP